MEDEDQVQDTPMSPPEPYGQQHNVNKYETDTPASPEPQSSPRYDYSDIPPPRSPDEYQYPDPHGHIPASPPPPASPEQYQPGVDYPASPSDNGFQNGRRTPNSIPPESPSDERIYRSCESTPPQASPDQVHMRSPVQNISPEPPRRQSLVAVSPAHEDEGEIREDVNSQQRMEKKRNSFEIANTHMSEIVAPATKKPAPLAEVFSSSSSDDDEEKDPQSRLEKLKTMRFAAPNKKAFSGPDQQRQRNVRSFLHEKGIEEVELNQAPPPEPKPTNRRRSASPEEERERHPRRKRRYDEEERRETRERREKPAPRDIPVNPHHLMQKIQALVVKADAPGVDVTEDELRSSVLDAFLFDRELKSLLDKRDLLIQDMNGFASLEKDLIKKIHSELPAHMQKVIKIEGDNVAINDAPVLNPMAPPPGMPFPPFPVGMFPPMPSLLGGKSVPGMPPGMPPFPPGMPPPPLGPNGMPMFPFPGMPPFPGGLPPPGLGAPIMPPKKELERPQSISPEPMETNAITIPPPTEKLSKTPPPISFPANFNQPPPSLNMAPPTSVPPPVPQPHHIPDFSKPPPISSLTGQNAGMSKNASAPNLPDLAKPPPTMTAPPPVATTVPPPSLGGPPPVLAFNVPPPNMAAQFDKHDAEPSAPYLGNTVSRPPPMTANNSMASTSQSLTAPVSSDLSKTITSMITNAIKGTNKPPTHQQAPYSGMPSFLGSSSMGGPMMDMAAPSSGSPMKGRQPPPSLMSIPTSDPYNLGTLRIGGGAGFKGSNTPKRGRGGREMKESSNSPMIQ